MNKRLTKEDLIDVDKNSILVTDFDVLPECKCSENKKLLKEAYEFIDFIACTDKEIIDKKIKFSARFLSDKYHKMERYYG